MGQVNRGKVFGLAATYVGTVIGAGFASGQEIWTFFGRFGPAGFAGLVLSGVLFAIAGARLLAMGAGGQAGDTYYQSLQALGGPLAPFLDLVLLVFLCVLGGVMLAGAGALSQQYAWPAWPGILVTAFLALAVIAAGIPGIVAVNKVVVPCLILVAAAMALMVLVTPSLPAPPPHRPGWLPASLLYTSYNTVLSLPVLVALGATEPDGRIRRAGAVLGAAGLCLIGGLILAGLLRTPALSAGTEVPMAAIASRMAGPIAVVYPLVLWAELFTTLVADVYGTAIRLRQAFGGPSTAWAGAVMMAGIALSRLGFARLVRTAYPAFGFVCLFVLFRLAVPCRRLVIGRSATSPAFGPPLSRRRPPKCNGRPVASSPRPSGGSGPRRSERTDTARLKAAFGPVSRMRHPATVKIRYPR